MSNLQSLIDWVSIESPTRHTAGVNAMMDRVASEAADSHLAVERIEGRDGLGDLIVLRAGPANGEAPLVIASHLDTVHPVGTAAGDLAIRIEGDRLFGPGIYDMKGGAWLAFEAFKTVAASGAARRPLVFLFTPDEEIGSPTSRGLIEALSKNARAMLVTEPARDGGKCVTGRKGVGRFDVRIEGRPAHAGSKHELGRSAIREAARQVLAIEGMTDYARGVTTTVGMITGGTAANVTPQKAWFSVDLRVVTDADGLAFERAILGLRPNDPDIGMTITGGMNRPPMERNPATIALYEEARRHAADLGFDLGEVPLAGGGSDGNFSAALGTPTLDGLGIDGDGAHTLGEYGLISSIAPRRALMERLLASL
jgi:glutamate carboxypeptidase